MGTPLLGYPVNPGDTNYYTLGCGDVISGPVQPSTDRQTCPAHGPQSIVAYSGAVMLDPVASVPRS
jgi:hypothetical protein